jgi:phage gp36-like protein
MMYITLEELRTAIYAYQRNQISENDDTILQMNILAAQEEIRSYLAGRYDVEKIFDWDGSAQRNPLLVEYTKSIAVWYLIRLSNPDIFYEKAKLYYEYAVTWLNDVADGKLNPDLPVRDDNSDGVPDGGMSWGSAAKNNNDY